MTRFRRQVPLELTVEPRHDRNVCASVSRSVSQLVIVSQSAKHGVCPFWRHCACGPEGVAPSVGPAVSPRVNHDTLGRVAVAPRSFCRQGGRCLFSAAPPFKPTRSTSEGLLLNSINSWLPAVCCRKNT